MNFFGYPLEQVITIILTMLLACISIITFIWSLLSFDKLLQFQYMNYHSSWEKDGRLRGVFWIPPDELLVPLGAFSTKLMASSISGTRWLQLIWFLSPPNWQYNDLRAKSLMIRYRIPALFFILSFLGMLTGMADLMILG